MSHKVDTSKLSKRSLKRIGHELKHNPPAILSRTRRKYGAKRAEKQRKAILLSKARRQRRPR